MAQPFARYFFVPPLTNEDLIALGLKPKDIEPTPVVVGDKQVGFELESKGTYQVEIRCWDLQTGERRILPGMGGIVAKYAYADAPLTDFALLTETTLLTKVHETFHAGPDKRGKYLTATCCWQTKTGNRGDWVPVQSAIVP